VVNRYLIIFYIYHILSGGDGDGDENNYITVVRSKKKYRYLMVTNAMSNELFQS